MLAALFFGFLALGIVLLLAGSFTGDAVLSLVGLAIVFLIGVGFITNGLEYRAGLTRNESEQFNTTTNITRTTVSEAYVYSSYHNKTIAFYLAALAALGFGYVLSTLKWFNRGGDND